MTSEDIKHQFIIKEKEKRRRKKNWQTYLDRLDVTREEGGVHKVLSSDEDVFTALTGRHLTQTIMHHSGARWARKLCASVSALSSHVTRVTVAHTCG